MSLSSVSDRESYRYPSVQETVAVSIAEMVDNPALLLESLYYSQEDDLMAVTRAVAALDTEARLEVLAFALERGRQADAATVSEIRR